MYKTLKRNLKRLLLNQSGAVAIEYALIGSVLGIGTIGGVIVLEEEIADFFDTAGAALGMSSANTPQSVPAPAQGNNNGPAQRTGTLISNPPPPIAVAPPAVNVNGVQGNSGTGLGLPAQPSEPFGGTANPDPAPTTPPSWTPWSTPQLESNLPIRLRIATPPRSPSLAAGHVSFGNFGVDRAGGFGAAYTEGGHQPGVIYDATLSFNANNFDHITDLVMLGSDYEYTPSPPDSSGDWVVIGWWDTDVYGGRGTDGSQAGVLISLWAKNRGSESERKLVDLKTTSTSDTTCQTPPAGYELLGCWDVVGRHVDANGNELIGTAQNPPGGTELAGATASDGSTGTVMFNLFAKWEDGQTP